MHYFLPAQTTVLQFQCKEAPVTLNQDVTVSSDTLANCGASRIVFDAKPGQRLNISAQYFDWDETSTGNCRNHHGTIRDSISSNSASICSGNKREDHVMVSNGNSIEIRPSNGASSGAFLLHIKGNRGIVLFTILSNYTHQHLI